MEGGIKAILVIEERSQTFQTRTICYFFKAATRYSVSLLQFLKVKKDVCNTENVSM